MDLKYHHIYIAINAVYTNPIIPIIPDLIISYLLDNMDKLNHYLNNKVHIGQVLDYLSNKNYKTSKEMRELITNYIEKNSTNGV